MRVEKWGNSLAVRLPASVVETLGLREGDEIEIEIAGERRFKVNWDRSRERALARLHELKRPLPAGFRLSRDDANER
jgi:antitoxin MazE